MVASLQRPSFQHQSPCSSSGLLAPGFNFSQAACWALRVWSTSWDAGISMSCPDRQRYGWHSCGQCRDDWSLLLPSHWPWFKWCPPCQSPSMESLRLGPLQPLFLAKWLPLQWWWTCLYWRNQSKQKFCRYCRKTALSTTTAKTHQALWISLSVFISI